MKFIFFLILTLQLIAIVQSQAAIGSGSGAAAEGAASGSDGSNGTGGNNGSGGGGNNSVQPATTPTSNPTTPANTGSPATQATPSNSPSPEPQTPTTQQASPSDQTTPSNTPDNTPSTGTTGNNNNTYSRNNSRTRSNNNSQTGNPTNSPSTGSGSSNNDNNSSSNNNNNQGQGQQQDQGDQNSQGSGDNVGKIAGGVVGGVVALALVGGLLTWLNRRGGCTSRTKRRNHDTFDDFAMKDPESDKMGYNDTAMTSVSGGGNPASPFQRRMAPIGPQTTGYMNLGNEEFSETSTAVPLMNQDMSGYPHSGVMQPPPSDGYYGGYATPDYKTQLHQPADTWHQQDPSSAYYPPPVTSPGHDHQMKPDTVDHKPHEI